MQRMGSVIALKGEKINEYKRLHADAWPGVLVKISECNISNYSIFFREPENLLFSYFEYHGGRFCCRCRQNGCRSRNTALVGCLQALSATA